MKIISKILIAILVLQMFTAAAYAAAEPAVNVNFTDEGIQLSGNAGIANDYLTIVLYKEGKSKDNLKNLPDGEAIVNEVSYVNVIKADKNGDFSLLINEPTALNTSYILQIEGKVISKELPVKNYGTIKEKEELVEFIKYKDGKVTIEGTAEEKNTVNIYIFSKEFTKYEVMQDESKVCAKLTATADENGYYRAEIPLNFSEDSYRLYVYEEYETYIYESDNHTIKKPKEIYVGENSEFKTIEQARDYLRTNLKDVPVNVIIKNGEYTVNSKIIFTSADSRTCDTAVTYMAEDTGKAKFTGTKKLNVDSFKLIDETDDVYNRLPENSKEKVLKINLVEQGFTKELVDFVSDYTTGGGYVDTLSVYLNDKEQKNASYPNNGYEKGAQPGTDASKQIVLDNSFSEKWMKADDMIINGFFSYAWIAECGIVDSIDSENGIFTFKYPLSYSVSNDAQGVIRWRALNLAEELDVPGEWYLDADTGNFYYYPPHRLKNTDKIEIAVLNNHIIEVSGDYLFFDGLNVGKNRGSRTSENDGLRVSGNNIRIENCIVNYTGDNGIRVTTGNNIIVDSCIISNTGNCGVKIKSGSTDDMKVSGSYIRNCDISFAGLHNENNSANGINVLGSSVGVVIENNNIHSIFADGIRYGGSKTIIRKNEIYNVSTTHADSGAIYAGRSWSQYGSVITENLIHSTGADGNYYHTDGIYLDDMHGGNTITRNIIVNNNPVAEYFGVHIAQGPDNTVTDNILINNSKNTDTTAFHFSSRNMTNLAIVTTALDNMSDAYFEAFPQLVKYKGIYSGINDSNYFSYVSAIKQYKENYNISDNVAIGFTDTITKPENMGQWQKAYFPYTYKITGTESNNVYEGVEFANAGKLDYRIQNNSKESLGLKKVLDEDFDINSIGMQKSFDGFEVVKNFKPLYPQYGQGVGKTDVTLSWEQALTFDKYKYEVAKDELFSEIVREGTTLHTSKEITNLDENTTYYWRITALTNSRTSKEKTSKIYMFTTSSEPISDGTVFGEANLFDENLNPVSDGKNYAGKTLKVVDKAYCLEKENQEVSYILIAEDTAGNATYKITSTILTKPDAINLDFSPLDENKEYKSYRLLRWESLISLKPIIDNSIWW